MTVVVRTVVILKRKFANGTPRVATAPFAVAGLGQFGQRSRSWTKLKTRTICLTGQYPPLVKSNRSLTIGGRAVRTLADEEIAQSVADNDPIDWGWENQGG